MAQLEFGQLYKFVVSLGLVLMGAAIVGPWAILRDEGALMVSEAELSGLTPLAREVLEAKQLHASRIVEWYPWVALAVFITGALLTIWGLRKWKPRQTVADKREDVGLATEERQLEPLTPDETAQRLEEEVTAAEAGSYESEASSTPAGEDPAEPGESPSESGAPISEDHSARRDRIRRTYEEVESLATSCIRAALPTFEAIQAGVKIVGEDGRDLGRADVVALASPGSREPSLVFEIKLTNSRNAARQTEAALLSAAGFAVALHPEAVGVALLVVDDEEEQRRAVDRVQSTLERQRHVLNARTGAVVLTIDELRSADPGSFRSRILAAVGGP